MTQIKCAECPFARLIEGNRYDCSAVHNTHNSVVRGHWDATDDCLDALATVDDIPTPEEQEEILTSVEETFCQNVETRETLKLSSTTPVAFFPTNFVDLEVDYILELEHKLEVDAQAMDAVYSDIEIDSVALASLRASATDATQLLGHVYRVWRGQRLLGLFWCSPFDGMWVTDSFCHRDSKRYDTAQDAQNAIVTAWN